MREMTFTELKRNLDKAMLVAVEDGFWNGEKEIKIKASDLLKKDIRKELLDRNVEDYVKANELSREDAEDTWFQLNRYYDIYAQPYISKEQRELEKKRSNQRTVWFILAAIGTVAVSIAWYVGIFVVSLIAGFIFAASKKK